MKDIVRLFQLPVEDFLESEVEKKSVDLVIIDPPYDSQDKHRSIGTTTRLKEWFPTIPNAAFPQIFRMCYDVLKTGHHAYVFCDENNENFFKETAREVGFSVSRSITWNKKYVGMGHSWRPVTERILFLRKGSSPKAVNDKSAKFTDLLTHLSAKEGMADTANALSFIFEKMGMEDSLIEEFGIRGGDGYPAEKPVALLEKLILNSTSPGDIVLDPFMGSGSTGEACLRNMRKFVGNDVHVMAVEQALSRLKQVAQGYKDFFCQEG